MNNKIVLAIVVLILIAGGFMIFKNKGEAPVVSNELEVGNSMPVPGDTNTTVEEKQVIENVPASSSNVKEFNVSATTFSFTPSSMTVNKGDTVKITVTNTKGTHDFKIDELNVVTRLLNTGEEQTITFVADKAGTFQYYCSVGSHRAMGMVGTLTVR